MDIGHSRYVKSFGNFPKNLQRLFIPDAHKGIHTAAVRLFKTSLKNIRNFQCVRHLDDMLRNTQGHCLSFNGTGPRKEKEVVAISVFEFGDKRKVHILNFPQIYWKTVISFRFDGRQSNNNEQESIFFDMRYLNACLFQRIRTSGATNKTFRT